jgi:hypothetical protein
MCRTNDALLGCVHRALLVSPEIRKIYDAFALDDAREADPAKQARPVAWTKVHNVPDYVYFDHRAHTGAGVTCQTCHGPVETMERVRQVGDLNMGWCVNCHREVTAGGVAGKPVDASIDCITCHY